MTHQRSVSYGVARWKRSWYLTLHTSTWKRRLKRSVGIILNKVIFFLDFMWRNKEISLRPDYLMLTSKCSRSLVHKSLFLKVIFFFLNVHGKHHLITWFKAPLSLWNWCCINKSKYHLRAPMFLYIIYGVLLKF